MSELDERYVTLFGGPRHGTWGRMLIHDGYTYIQSVRDGPAHRYEVIADIGLYAPTELPMLMNICLEAEEIQRIIVALKCTASLSDEQGHIGQAQDFRDLYLKLEDL